MLGRGKKEEEIPDVDPEEYEKFADRLDSGETVLMAVKQSRVKPSGAAIFTPNAIIDMLKMKFVNGEIIKEEFEENKKILEE